MTDKRFVNNLNALVKTKKRRLLGPASSRLAAEGGSGISDSTGLDDTSPASSGGGISSPVTEKKTAHPTISGTYLASREYVQEDDGLGGTQDKIFSVESVDGLYAFEYKKLQTIYMADANSDDVTFVYQEVDPDTGAAFPDP